MTRDQELLASSCKARARADTFDLGVGSNSPAVVSRKITMLKRRLLLGEPILHEDFWLGVAYYLVSNIGLKSVVAPSTEALILGDCVCPVNKRTTKTNLSKGKCMIRSTL